MTTKKIICVVGTRPEAIKMAPIILALRADPAFDVKVLATAQHRQMLDQVLNVFGITPDIDFNIMRPNQALTALTARLLQAFDEVLLQEKPDVVLAQGDTTTVLTAALACFYHRIDFGHVEAGLRTGDMQKPFPEEMNRVMAGRLARWHFAPTESSRQNLLKEGVPDNQIFVTGNSVIDALHSVSSRQPEIGIDLDQSKRLVLVTAHRRENFGKPFEAICKAVKELVRKNPDIQVLFPVHPNPNVRSVVHAELADDPRIILSQPLDYLPFVGAMQRAYLILTDSGGVQEEAPALGKPVLVLRHETERPEAVHAGVVKLIGPNYDAILENAQALLDDEALYASMAKGVSPYGDGQAARRTVDVLKS
ncbi:UDP-N-acetylglucosamine 2-epimerase (non-hydrolyzing) [Herbaspirillum huttiense]|uniref:non-hydrolyzing UDP-N-acetylglucosamine 2-epimerase n=1 Tax=Herbaspirillum huttiense TaxID=863372 RepID=UPI003877BA3C